jgi:hypothetical protein
MGGTTIVRSGAPLLAPAEVESRRDAIREELSRVLTSSLFRSSKHYPALLRYVVERMLEGGGTHLKERSLGVAVFGRDPSYDTNLDPVVRTSACEVRKRLAQYYNDAGRDSEMRIDLPAGSYTPEFRLLEPPPAPAPAPIEAPPVTVPVVGAPVAIQSVARWKRPPTLIAAAALGLIALAITTADVHGARPAIERFWAPVWRSSETVTICVAAPYDPDAPSAEASTPSGPSYLEVMRNDRMAFGDALTMARLTGLLRENGKQYDVRRGTASTLEDFRKGPAILIGAYNNAWTMRLENQLRYTFEREPGSPVGFIRDRQNPSKAMWVHHPELPYSRLTYDYAIVSRFVDSRTEQTIVVVAGMGKDGTIAAGEFVSQPRYLDELATLAPGGWERKNLQVVLATELINGNAAPPRIVATHFW